MKSQKLLDAIGEIDDSLVDGASAPKSRAVRFPKRKIISLVAAVACIVIITIVGILQFSGDTNIHINVITGEIGTSPYYFDPEKHHEVEMSNSKIIKYYGKDFSTLIPLDGFEYLDDRVHTVLVQNSDDTIVRDALSFIYVDTDDSSRLIMISLSKVNLPYHTQYQFKTSNTSNISDKEILIAGKKHGNSNTNYDLLIADFSHNGANYRVKADNLSNKEFENVLENILKR